MSEQPPPPPRRDPPPARGDPPAARGDPPTARGDPPSRQPPEPPPAPWLDPDEALLRECDMTFFVAGGPGGQHRNKTESAVRLVHRPTGIVVTATERRSQHQNREVALARLREKIAALRRTRKPRKKTKPTHGSKLRRVEGKRKASVKKSRRGRPGGED